MNRHSEVYDTHIQSILDDVGKIEKDLTEKNRKCCDRYQHMLFNMMLEYDITLSQAMYADFSAYIDLNDEGLSKLPENTIAPVFINYLERRGVPSSSFRDVLIDIFLGKRPDLNITEYEGEYNGLRKT